ncbi:NAD-dependent epimerase/dehydratase family protein [Microbacterium sp. P02]|uniref:NAD-dependent epimerase/dehydratase family protein n=1 Tax=Microbacterium sp. P02 TaxID=3366260 RepID=UPI003672A80D
MNILVLGGTAWLSHCIASMFVDGGHDVTCVARGSSVPAGARLVNADRDVDDALGALAGERWDAVIDVARQPGHVRTAVRDLASAAGMYVFVSTGNVYASHQEVGADEDALLVEPLAADHFTDPEQYGAAKVACEEAALAAFGIDRVLIARAGLIGGPGDHTQRTSYWPWRFAHPAAEHTVLVPDAPELPTAVIDVRDLAAWLVRCVEGGVTGIYNAMGAVLTFPAHLAAASAAARSSAIAVLAPEPWLQEHDVSEWAGPRSLPLWLVDRSWYGFNGRSNARAVAAGLTLRPLVETLEDGLAERAAHPPDVHLAGLTDADERALISELELRAE